MADGSLVDDLTATLQHLDDLAEQHQEAEAYAATQARLAYLHDLLRQMHTEVTTFKQDALQSGNAALWHATCADLRTDEPPTLRAPARALISADPTLLDLIAYVSASLARIRERRAGLALHREVGIPPPEQA
jgi:hypothetical protein